MAKGSNYMRGLCIAFNILLGIFGMVLLLFGIIANSVKVEPAELGSTTLNVMSCIGFGLATILLSVLGLYGAYREQVLALILYCFFMTIEFIVLMVLAIIATLAQPQIEKVVMQSFSKIPLREADTAFLQELNKLQSSAECCGLRDYHDWEEEIPDSCHCPPNHPDRVAKCKSIPRNKIDVEGINTLDTQSMVSSATEIHIYSTNCGPIIVEYVKNDIRIMLGIIFTLITVMVAAVLVALLLIYKIHKRSPATEIAENDDRVKYVLRPETMS